ncbi:MAG: tetratricopeptide repeat protein [Xanthomarina sp.]
MNSQELLYLYFSKSLTAEQENLFQNLLESNAEFKMEFEFEKQLRTAIKSYENDRLKIKLQEVEQEIIKPTFTLFNYKNYAIAASLALLVGWFGYNSFFDTNYNTLFDANFSDYPNTVYSITRSDTIKTTEREAFVAYETKNYLTAIEKFDALPEDVNKKYINFYKAVSYLSLENTEKAKGLFVQVVQEDEELVAESIWYLALIAIKEQEKDEAKVYLENLITNYNYNKEKSQKILNTFK